MSGRASGDARIILRVKDRVSKKLPDQPEASVAGGWIHNLISGHACVIIQENKYSWYVGKGHLVGACLDIAKKRFLGRISTLIK